MTTIDFENQQYHKRQAPMVSLGFADFLCVVLYGGTGLQAHVVSLCALVAVAHSMDD